VDNRRLIREQFSSQAGEMEDRGYVFADPGTIAWMLEHVPPGDARAVLDVAGGTGQVARAYARAAALAIVLDATAPLLERGRREADAAGLRNVVFELGDAAALPYLDRSFDLVVSRFAVHHFPDPAPPLAEMVRVCRTGGRIAVIDLVAPARELAVDYDRRERMRDPSHTRALPADDLCAAVEAAGGELVLRVERDRSTAVERWLSVTSPPPAVAEQLTDELRAELDGAAATGMRPRIVDGELHFTQRLAIVVAARG
jgi:SAM-dependent methyltransferase